MIDSVKFKVRCDKTMSYLRTPLKQSLKKNFEPSIENSNIENKMNTKEYNSSNFCEFNFLQDILLIKSPVLCSYWSNKIDKLIVFVKSLFQRDL